MKFSIWLMLWLLLLKTCDIQDDARRHAQEAREDARVVARACREGR